MTEHLRAAFTEDLLSLMEDAILAGLLDAAVLERASLLAAEKAPCRRRPLRRPPRHGFR